MSAHPILLFAFAASLAAQNPAVHPPGYATLPGESADSTFPVAAGVSRVMMLFETWPLGIPNQAGISAITYRRAPQTQSQGKQVFLQILMGPSLLPAASVDMTFANNYQTPPVTVFTAKAISLPNLGMGLPPVVENLTLLLDTPYPFDASKNLVLEYRVTANSNANLPFPYTLDVGAIAARPFQLGQGCPTSANTIPVLDTQPVGIGSSWYTTLGSAPGSTTAYLILGVAQFTPPHNLAGLGAPACNVYPIPVVLLPAPTSQFGSAQWNFPIPYDQALFGATLYIQAYAHDAFAPGMLTFSNGQGIPIGTIPPGTLIANLGNASATTASYSQPNHGLVTKFHY